MGYPVRLRSLTGICAHMGSVNQHGKWTPTWMNEKGKKEGGQKAQSRDSQGPTYPDSRYIC